MSQGIVLGAGLLQLDIFNLIPSILSLALCFTDWNGFGEINFVAFQNFFELFNDRVFKIAVWHNFIWTIFFLTVPIAVALLGAFILTGVKKFQLVYRFIFFFPFN